MLDPCRRGAIALVFALMAHCACGRAPEPLLSGVLVRASEPAPGLPVLSDLTVFRDRLYVAASRNPLVERGAAVLASRDGREFTRLLDQPLADGFARIRVIDDVLFVPGLDPPGTAPGRVWISEDGGTFRSTLVPGAVHAYDVAAHEGAVVLSGALEGGRLGALFVREGLAWREILRQPYSRLKFLLPVGNALLVAKTDVGTAVDYLVLRGPVDAIEAEPRDVVAGEAITFRWFTSSRGVLFWSLRDETGLRCLTSDDAESWSPVPGLDGRFVSDFAELRGNLYALAQDGVHGSTDHRTFRPVAADPEGAPFDPVPAEGVYNADATASMVAFRGELLAGSSRNGVLYALMPEGSREEPVARRESAVVE